MAGIQQKYRALVALAPDPIMLLDPEAGTLREVNERAAEILGYEVDTLVGMEVSDLHPSENSDAYRNLFERTVEQGEIQAETLDDGSQIFLRTAEGTEVPVALHAKTVDIEGETLLYSIARDISDRYERDRRLERQRDQLAEFAKVVSHDLRNPLGVAMSRLELARDEHDNEHLARAVDALNRMNCLIDDLLELAKQGESAGDLSTVALAEICTAAWRSVETPSATLSLEVDGTVRADPERLQQLFENLFGNAVAHGGSAVSVTVGPLDEGFYVADDGVGIPPEERDRVFEAGHTTSTHGTGLGLRIVDQIVDAHGWTIHLTASDSGGARFEVRGVETGW